MAVKNIHQHGEAFHKATGFIVKWDTLDSLEKFEHENQDYTQFTLSNAANQIRAPGKGSPYQGVTAGRYIRLTLCCTSQLLVLPRSSTNFLSPPPRNTPTAPASNSSTMYECEECEEEFWDLSDLEDHLNDFDHWAECETCNSVFRMQRSCNQHMDSLDHWAPRYECETCNKEFLSEHAARQHMTDKRHWTPKIPCETCSKMFRTQGAANQHMNDLGHWAPSIECETCTAKFPTQEKANQHMKALGHYENYCRDCDIKFQNENNLRMVSNLRHGLASNIRD